MAWSKYDEERWALGRQYEDGMMNRVEYQRELAKINRRERSEIRRLATAWRGMGMIRSPR